MYLLPGGSSPINNRKWNLGRFGLAPVQLRGLRGFRGLGQSLLDTTMAPDINTLQEPSGSVLLIQPIPGISTTTSPDINTLVPPSLPSDNVYGAQSLTPAQIAAGSAAATAAATPSLISQVANSISSGASSILKALTPSTTPGAGTSSTLLLVAIGALAFAVVSGRKRRR